MTSDNKIWCKSIQSRTFCTATQRNIQRQRRKSIYFPRINAYVIFTSLYQAVELSNLPLLYIVYQVNMPEISVTWLINIHGEPSACWPSATKLVLFVDATFLRTTKLPQSCDIGDTFDRSATHKPPDQWYWYIC